ncbi:MAG: methylated-DNA--[protein]-cysteine S-methyltransferase [Candidatus Omnitrophica bacterium]|nr:methylated-DNA--[protein]-cysteine S-methyltransferase [Candidatus Omnitrophota bacterium]
MELIQYVMRSKIGPLYLVASKEYLTGVCFQKQNIKTIKTFDPSRVQDKILYKTVQQLEEYFVGQRREFDLPVSVSGTPFQEKVWRELSKIPFAQTASYKDIARRIKNPKAVRAVGSANGHNPICIIIPCHRVITTDGSIGGYAGGPVIKRQLLAIEQG